MLSHNIGAFYRTHNNASSYSHNVSDHICIIMLYICSDVIIYATSFSGPRHYLFCFLWWLFYFLAKQMGILVLFILLVYISF